LIMNAELSAVKVSVPRTAELSVWKHWDEWKFVIVHVYWIDHCNGHGSCNTLTSNEAVEIPLTSSCLSLAYPDSKTYHMQSRPFHFESVERRIRHGVMQLSWTIKVAPSIVGAGGKFSLNRKKLTPKLRVFFTVW
jgi:hypothetical protein